MARDDWMRGERLRTDWRSRQGRRDEFGRWDDASQEAYASRPGPTENRGFDRQDYGQADYSVDYAYDPDRRAGYRVDPERGRDDLGQADYSRDYAYDADNRRGFRRYEDEPRDAYARRMDEGDYRRDHDRARGDDDSGRPSWRERAGAFFGGRPVHDDNNADEIRAEEARRREVEPQRSRRRGPSDRVLWAVIVERLEDQRGLDLRDLEVLVHDGEVTLNGTVKRKSDKRRIEDIADIDGVRNVQNNLRVRERGWF